MFLNENCIFPVCFITRERSICLYNRGRIHKIDHPAAKNMLSTNLKNQIIFLKQSKLTIVTCISNAISTRKKRNCTFACNHVYVCIYTLEGGGVPNFQQ